jgi:metal-responsive CopG/Arc/MetJ family transcriptional regulator
MLHAITVRLTAELDQWLNQVSRETGIPRSEIVREYLERARNDKKTPRFMRLAGAIKGARGLSARKGYSRTVKVKTVEVE